MMNAHYITSQILNHCYKLNDYEKKIYEEKIFFSDEYKIKKSKKA